MPKLKLSGKQLQSIGSPQGLYSLIEKNSFISNLFFKIFWFTNLSSEM